MNKEIQRVSNGKEKEEVYRKYLEKYNKAIKYEFYLEAIMISYAMMEDRLIAILHYLGIVTRTRKNLAVNKFCRPDIHTILGYKEKASIKIQNISVKIKVLNALSSGNFQENLFLYDAAKLLNRKQSDEDISIQELCKQITEWCNLRNQYVHALLNKKYAALQAGLPEFAEEGLAIAREIDKKVKTIKKNNNIRKKYNIQSGGNYASKT